MAAKTTKMPLTFIILALTAWLPAAAFAQGAAEAPAAAESSLPLTYPVFSDVIDKPSLLKKYPFLNQSGLSIRQIANEKVNNIDFILVTSSQPGECGSLGCPLNIYADENGTGYKEVLVTIFNRRDGIMTMAPHNDSVSIFFCMVGRGSSEWILQDGSFVHQEKASPEAPSCEPY